MILSKQAIDAINSNNRIRKRLSLDLDVDIRTVDSWAEKNEQDGDLTRIKAIQIIHEETGLAQSEILTAENNAA